MKTKDVLFDLVHCLNSSEKRQFKIQLQKHAKNKDSNIARLFDAFNKLPYFCEKELLSNLKGDKILKNLTYEKHRLQQAIIDFLASKDVNNPRVQLDKMVRQAYALRAKNQMELSLKTVEKAIKIAKSYELNEYTYMFLDFSFMLRFRLDFRNVEALLSICDELKELGAKIQHESIYRAMRHESAILNYIEANNTNHKVTDALNAFKENTFFTDESKATTFTSKMHLYISRTSFYYNKESNKSIEALEKTIQLLEANPLQKEYYYRHYLGSLFHLVQVNINLKKFDESFKYLTKIKKLKKEFKLIMDSRTIVDIEGDTLYLTFDILADTFNIDLLSELFEKRKTTLKEYVLSAVRNIEVYFYFGLISDFYNKNYDACLDWSIEQDSIKDQPMQQHTVFSCKTIVLLASYEQKEFALMRSQFSNLYYFARTENLTDPYFKMSLKILRKLSNEPNIEPQKFKGDLEKYRSLVEKTSSYLGNKNLLMWLESKIEGTSFVEVINREKQPIDKNAYKKLLKD